MIDRSINLRRRSNSGGDIFLLLFNLDRDRAFLYKNKGIKVAIGGVDDFFFELPKAIPETKLVFGTDDKFLGRHPSLAPTTIDIEHQLNSAARNVSAMFSGSPSSYADITAGYTFDRSVKMRVSDELLENKQFAVLLGASGVGKTTFARQLALALLDRDYLAWEHSPDRELIVQAWRNVAKELQAEKKDAVFVLDDAHLYLSEINSLVDLLEIDGSSRLRLILTSASNHWKLRVKAPHLFKNGIVETLSSLDAFEVSSLLSLVEKNNEVKKLVDKSFRGFTTREKCRRLNERCNRDFFVCMKNIFANESFDTIVLREYAQIPENFREIYKHICALESFGVRVHRQLVIRLLSIEAQDIQMVLANLEGLVSEYEVRPRESIYSWKGRHPVISEIITKHKFNDYDKTFLLLKRVVENLSPTYDIEIRTLRQLCNFGSGVGQISDIGDQNELFRMMISVAPRERVPRHRLISNLIRQGEFPDAETEIRVFENDLGADGPVRRFKVRLTVERAISTTGLMREDKARLLNDAHDSALGLVNEARLERPTLQLYADVCYEIFKITGEYSYIDEALSFFKRAEKEVGDPDITRAIVRFEQRIQPVNLEAAEFSVQHVEAD